MADLKNLFNTFKRDGYVVKYLDQYLLGLNSHDEDRATDVNSPSQVGVCMRARYYSRTGAVGDPNSVDARTRRIFDNGTKMHERVQEYLTQQGMLLMSELPVFDKDYKILGSSDGIIRISEDEIAILELKSINSNGFSRLTEVKDEHYMQGLVYVYCVERHRQYIHKLIEDGSYAKSRPNRRKVYVSLYPHLKDGSKHDREDKIAYRVNTHIQLDDILSVTKTPVTKSVFVYENKDTQDMKEFVVSSTDEKAKDVTSYFLRDYKLLNSFVDNHEIPDRCCSSKSDSQCRWCGYKTECWG